MLILRLGIVLLIIAMFLPSSAEEKQQVYRGVSNAVDNVQTFCVRNAAFCDSVGTVASALADRAYYGAQMVYDAAIGAPQQDRGGWNGERPYPSQIERSSRRDEGRARTQPARSTDTLRREDLAPAWRGPGAS
ncbi:DUF5330 domain-containing protein [Dichotomicrobium thermohalophilum]|uniref:DUF5330 domain-containing protein n=1 Tax=Dichotomicrobium thermohalophilum TaxID=933063 RepID=A0A397QAR6_9HYPH|nr:DUF5330 domain-containing protein [Dichotomicrobium thermohalophilum]RIA55311.1 hypothetical protein BXY53_0372 [Dichotomicrobium thermohalophilum]